MHVQAGRPVLRERSTRPGFSFWPWVGCFVPPNTTACHHRSLKAATTSQPWLLNAPSAHYHSQPLSLFGQPQRWATARRRVVAAGFSPRWWLRCGFIILRCAHGQSDALLVRPPCRVLYAQPRECLRIRPKMLRRSNSPGKFRPGGAWLWRIWGRRNGLGWGEARRNDSSEVAHNELRTPQC